MYVRSARVPSAHARCRTAELARCEDACLVTAGDSCGETGLPGRVEVAAAARPGQCGRNGTPSSSCAVSCNRPVGSPSPSTSMCPPNGSGVPRPMPACLSAIAIHDAHVTACVADHHRVFGAHGVEVGPGDVTSFDQLVVVVAPATNPFARRRDAARWCTASTIGWIDSRPGRRNRAATSRSPGSSGGGARR